MIFLIDDEITADHAEKYAKYPIFIQKNMKETGLKICR